LKNRAATSEEPFTVVVSKAKKKNMQKGFQVHNTRSRGRHPDWVFSYSCFILFLFGLLFIFILLFFFFLFYGFDPYLFCFFVGEVFGLCPPSLFVVIFFLFIYLGCCSRFHLLLPICFKKKKVTLWPINSLTMIILRKLLVVKISYQYHSNPKNKNYRNWYS
jgi:hypothetical protein